MRYTIRIKRQENKEAKPFWQEFEIEAEGELSIAAMLNELNARQKLTDKSGKEAEPISWECGCMVKKCGACAMRINGLPELACSTFLQSLKGKVIVLEPLSKFPVVKDLIVDRSVVFENLKILMRYAINQQDVLCVDVVLRSVRILILGKTSQVPLLR